MVETTTILPELLLGFGGAVLATRGERPESGAAITPHRLSTNSSGLRHPAVPGFEARHPLGPARHAVLPQRPPEALR